MPKHYIILSLKYSKPDEPVFWRSNDAGYTTIPWAAGIYTEEQVKRDPAYYNDGYNTIAVPLTDEGIEQSGLQFKLDMEAVKRFVSANRHKEVRNG